MNRRKNNPVGAQIVERRRNIQREREILETPAAAFTGTAIEVLMDRLAKPDCNEVEAVRIGLAIQGILRGDAALINNLDDPGVAETVNNLIEKRAEADKASEEFENNRVKFLTEVMDKAESLRKTGTEQDKIIASSMNMYQTAKEVAKAEQTNRRLKIRYRVANDPKILVDVQPWRFHTTVNGVMTEVEEDPIIGISGMYFRLSPGQRMIPKIIADRYFEILRGKQEVAERKAAMAAYRSASTLEQTMQEIDRKYNTKSEHIFDPRLLGQ